MIEVVQALATMHGAKPAEVESRRAAKARQNGAFNQRIWLIDTDDGHVRSRHRQSGTNQEANAVLDKVDTPALIIDEDIVDANIARMASHAKARNVGLRPHTKTHKTSHFATLQVNHGADGIMVAKLGEAEIMRQADLLDQSIGYPLIGEMKRRRLRDLVLSGVRARVSVDSREGLALLDAVYRETGVPIDALVEIDTGMHRCGLWDAAQIVELADLIEKTPGVKYRGITCFGGHIAQTFEKDAIIGRIRAEDHLLAELVQRLQEAGLAPEIISEGGTIPAAFLEELHVATEIRPGTYIFNDVSTVASHAAQWEDCAATVLATVVSLPSPDRAIIDAGSKALGLDGPVDGSYGRVTSDPDLKIVRLSEEHGFVRRADGGPVNLAIGDRLQIVPVHICPTVNLYDFGSLVRGGVLLGELPIEARGSVR